MTQGNFPEVSKTRIYSIASTALGIGAFTADANQNTSNNTAFDNAWEDFFPAWIEEHQVKGFIREEVLTSQLVDGQGSVDTGTLVIPKGFTYAYTAPVDMILPLEVDFLEPIRGAEGNRWQWATVSYENSSTHTQLRCIVTDAPSSIRVKFVFFPNDGGDTAYESQVSPAIAQAIGHSFAWYLAPSFGKSLQERQDLERRALRALVAAKVVDGQVGSRRYRREGRLVQLRRERW